MKFTLQSGCEKNGKIQRWLANKNVTRSVIPLGPGIYFATEHATPLEWFY